MILIHPFAKPLMNGRVNPKTQLVNDFRKNLPISELSQLLKECRTWVSIDSFFQHLAWKEKKLGIVLWSVSDPNIFGHPENINLLKDRANLAKNQFLWWEFVEHESEKFVKPDVVIKSLQNIK